MSKRKIRNIITSIIFLIVAITAIYFGDIEVNENILENTTVSYNLGEIPEYNGKIFVTINNNIPNFEESDFTSECFERYSKLDKLGRCGVAFANLGKETMPKEGEKRTSISHIYPSGWQSVEYNGKSLYNRCHLIAYSLSAENANKQNLITGTNYFNTSGMLPFETKVLEYLRKNEKNHVLYRVIPIFERNNLVASGVQMEAQSVENKEICFNVYIYNVQPNIEIDYSNGYSKLKQ